MKRILLIGALSSVLTFTGCATTQPALQTQSGYPEVDIKSSSKQLIKDKLIFGLTGTGWSLEQETDSILTFTKSEDPGTMRGMMTQMLIGNAYSTTPKYEARYTISTIEPNHYRVIASASISSQNAYGQTNKYPLNGKSFTENIQSGLNVIKKEVEKEQIAQQAP